ncbi:MAG TPA: nuclear transport factor 2 family protein [Actinopolymorphaceae bacterium]
MTDDLADFQQFMRRREEAARAYVTGDPAPLGRLVAERSPATFFGPQGGLIDGADTVWTTYREGAAAFGPESVTHFEVLHMAASDGLAYWVGVQRARVRLGDAAEPRPMDLRVTELFRRENGEWKLIHRHADPLAEP